MSWLWLLVFASIALLTEKAIASNTPPTSESDESEGSVEFLGTVAPPVAAFAVTPAFETAANAALAAAVNVATAFDSVVKSAGEVRYFLHIASIPAANQRRLNKRNFFPKPCHKRLPPRSQLACHSLVMRPRLFSWVLS